MITYAMSAGTTTALIYRDGIYFGSISTSQCGLWDPYVSFIWSTPNGPHQVGFTCFPAAVSKTIEAMAGLQPIPAPVTATEATNCELRTGTRPYLRIRTPGPPHHHSLQREAQ